MYSIYSCFHEASVIQKSERGLHEVGTSFQVQVQTVRNTLQIQMLPARHEVKMSVQAHSRSCWRVTGRGKHHIFTLVLGSSIGDKTHLLSTLVLPLKGDFHQLLNQIQKLRGVSVMTLNQVKNKTKLFKGHPLKGHPFNQHFDLAASPGLAVRRWRGTLEFHLGDIRHLQGSPECVAAVKLVRTGMDRSGISVLYAYFLNS